MVETLSKQFGIDTGRMEGQGVGPLASQAGNADEPGRAENRRVVVVVK